MKKTLRECQIHKDYNPFSQKLSCGWNAIPFFLIFFLVLTRSPRLNALVQQSFSRVLQYISSGVAADIRLDALRVVGLAVEQRIVNPRQV